MADGGCRLRLFDAKGRMIAEVPATVERGDHGDSIRATESIRCGVEIACVEVCIDDKVSDRFSIDVPRNAAIHGISLFGVRPGIGLSEFSYDGLSVQHEVVHPDAEDANLPVSDTWRDRKPML